MSGQAGGGSGEFNIEVQRQFKNQAALHNWSKIT